MAIFQKMVINAGSYPACGLSGMNVTGNGTLFSHSLQSGLSGIAGGFAARLQQLANGGVHTQYTFGWTINQMEPGGTDPPLGSTRYHRFYIKVTASPDYAGNSGPWYTKFIIHGNDVPGTNEGRMITNFGVGHVNNLDSTFEAQKNVSGIGVLGIISQAVWHAVQIEVKAATTLLGTNGSIKIWIDNDVLASPNDVETGMNLTTNGWGGQTTAICGGFAQTTIAVGSTVYQDIGGYEYADAFDPAWFANMAVGSVVTPPVTPDPGPGMIPLGTPFLMRVNQVYKLPAKKCTMFIDTPTPSVVQSNAQSFTNSAPVTFVNASTDLGGAFVKCTSGDVTVTVKAS